MTRCSGAILLAFLVLAAGAAGADPAKHDGFYFRVGVGPGFALGTLYSSAADNSSHGVDISTELAVGTTIRHGLVLGLGTFPMIVPAPTYDTVDAGGQHVSATGPFVDYYFDPEHAGLHVQGGILFGAGYIAGSSQRASHIGFGYGATAGVGYDFFVADKWSVGGLARVTPYHLYGVDNDIRLVSPSVLVTATYH
jgi:hypothetical protein